MGELTVKVDQLDKKIETLLQQVHDLTVLVLKNRNTERWVPEEEAAAMIGYAPRVLRVKVKTAEGKFCHIEMQHNNGRNYKYSRKGIEKYLQLTSTM